MSNTYDKYYQTENLFGDPYPELIEFFDQFPIRGKVLDLGCGQGRNAIPLARLGYSVTGIDQSHVGISQMNHVGQNEHLALTGLVGDIYSFETIGEFDIILMDSMFHFAKKEKQKEIGLIKRIISDMRHGSVLVICIQDTGNKVQTLKQILDIEKAQKQLLDVAFNYIFEDAHNGHKSETPYRMIAIEKHGKP